MAKRDFPVKDEKVEENKKKVEESVLSVSPLNKPKKYSGVTKGS